ncbi:hypothetical protein ACIBK1_06790 [Microbispora rosea]|uniref:hypothetical protein n=1 Tax=Microbispora rosea TaxID=58117 RepID=UPI0037949F32
MGLRAWLKGDKGSVNGQHAEPPPAVPADEPRMATELGDALTAYWRTGHWFGSDSFIAWLIKHGHISEAEFALTEVMLVAPRNKDVWTDLRRLERNLKKLTGQADQRPDAPVA